MGFYVTAARGFLPACFRAEVAREASRNGPHATRLGVGAFVLGERRRALPFLFGTGFVSSALGQGTGPGVGLVRHSPLMHF